MVRLIVLLLVGNTGYAGDSAFDVIRVYHRPAAEIEALLKPMLNENDQVAVDGAALVVKTSAANLPTIRTLVKKLDVPLQNLLITVLQSEQIGLDELNGENAPILLPGQARPYYSYRTKKQKGGDRKYTLRVQEGKPAIIESQRTYSVQNYQSYSYGGGYYGAGQSSEQAETGSGFSVTPKLAGQQVWLDIAPWMENGVKNGQITGQEARTTVKTDLGKWVEIGSLEESAYSSTNRTKGRVWQTNADRGHIYIKVDKVD
jgi:hypothetical protein